jgi:hypothetical protein
MASNERVSPKQAAELLGVSKKAVEQALQRGSFPNVERDVNAKTGRVLRVWIARSDVEAYAAQRGRSLPEASSEARPKAATPKPDSKRRQPASRVRFVGMSPERQNEVLQGVLEELSSENLALRVRVRELEARLGES